MKERAGFYKVNFQGEEAEYKSFVPSPLPPVPPVELDEECVELLVRANKALVSLNGLSIYIPDVDIFISMYVRKEALMSSQIEGTQATLEDIFDPANHKNLNRDVEEVVNYVKAINYSIERLKELPLCMRLIKETHAVLMEGVRGREKSPGEFRASQNWIGGGGGLKSARFIPPSPQYMVEAASDLEKYVNSDDGLDPLVRAALIHYQFETIHPFLDGNGRMGRLLVILFLIDKGILKSPVLYISYYLKKNRIEYYDRLSEVRNKGNYEQWIKFFLRAIAESAEDALTTVDRLLRQHAANMKKISDATNGAAMGRLFGYLEKNPIIEINKTAEALDLSFASVSSAVKKLEDMGILRQYSGGKRYRTFFYFEYIKILEEGTL
jgi:Uncharacterized conserved protein